MWTAYPFWKHTKTCIIHKVCVFPPSFFYPENFMVHRPDCQKRPTTHIQREASKLKFVTQQDIWYHKLNQDTEFPRLCICEHIPFSENFPIGLGVKSRSDCFKEWISRGEPAYNMALHTNLWHLLEEVTHCTKLHPSRRIPSNYLPR